MKSYGKMKAGKDKSKKEKRETLDDVPTFKKGTDEKSKPKKSGKAGNFPRKKKVTETSLPDDVSQHSEVANQLKSQTVVDDHHDAHRVKGKKRVSKTCEETVSHAVSEFFEDAWKACVERFFIQTAPVTVSFELRNTWLRLVEAEWQDPDMREKPSTKPNRIFKRDDPPLPLAFDTWSRGVIETMPSVRRESIMDPFLRDFDPFGKISFPTRHPSPSIISMVDDMDEDGSASPSYSVEGQTEARDPVQEQETPEEEEMEETDKPAEVAKPSGENDAIDGDEWNFELDPVLSNNILDQRSSEVRSSVASFTESHHSVGRRKEKSQIKLKQIETVLSARPFSWDESTTDFDYSTPPHSSGGKSARIINSTIRPKPIHKFSPSQCGGRVGSGVFRLPLETTSAALRKMRGSIDPNERVREPSESRILEQHAEDKHDIVQVSTRGHISQFEEDDFEVQPLFEEIPTRGNVQEDHNQEDKVWKQRSVSESRFKELPLDDDVASDHNKLQVRRRLINLHSRFKRQAMRSLAAKVRQGEAAMRPRLSNETVADSAASSVISSSNKTNRTKNKKPGNRASRSASMGGNLQLTQNKRTTKQTQDFTNYFGDVTEAAKGAASEPLLHAIIKEHQQRQEEHEAKEMQRQEKYLGRNNRILMGNVRKSSQKSDRRSFGNFGMSISGHMNPKDIEKVGVRGRGRGSSQCQNGRPQNRRIVCDYNNYDPCSLQPAPSDCRSAGTCSNIASPPRAFC